MKTTGGWALDRELFSLHAREVFEFAVPFRRLELKLGDDALRGVRFNSDAAVLARLESMFTEAEFMECPGPRIDSALVDAAQSDHWYQFEKKYDDEPPDETEIDDEE